MQGVPVGLVDDLPAKQGSHIHGIKVLGTCDDIPNICAGGRVDQIVVAVPSSTKPERDRIYKLCMETGVKTLTLPLIKDLPQGLDGKIALREVEIADLLAREENVLNIAEMGYVTGKRVLVTGGGGSIGSELVRQLLPAKPAQIILFDIYENTTYELFHEIVKPAKDDGIDIRVFIGSITHLPAIEKVFELYEPQVVFHAAAHKHVPLMERNAREAIENNVFGTLNVVRLANRFKCTHFVQISTDKAVNPANVMGATKRMDEMIVQYYAANSETIYTCVRFGNVLGSHGSVIPLFRKQLRAGGPITITHRDITRYFMTIPEASRLVITAGALAHGGEIFVLDMGEPVKIYDLAVNLVTLSGLKPGHDCKCDCAEDDGRCATDSQIADAVAVELRRLGISGKKTKSSPGKDAVKKKRAASAASQLEAYERYVAGKATIEDYRSLEAAAVAPALHQSEAAKWVGNSKKEKGELLLALEEHRFCDVDRKLLRKLISKVLLRADGTLEVVAK